MPLDFLHEQIEADLQLLFEQNGINLKGKKIIDIGGHDGNITLPLARLAYKMGATEVHVVDPRLDISDYDLENERIAGHVMRVENMPLEMKGTFDFGTLFAYQNSNSSQSYPQGIAEILKPDGKLLLAGRFGTNRADELKPFFGGFADAARDNVPYRLLRELNPGMFMLSLPVHSKALGLELLSNKQRLQSPQL